LTVVDDIFCDGFRVGPRIPQRLIDQMAKAGLPSTGAHPFEPRLRTNRRGELEIEKRSVSKGPKQGKHGYVDVHGRIWIRDRAHGGLPDHWDVQLNDGDDYIRIDDQGKEITAAKPPLPSPSPGPGDASQRQNNGH
jgi:hypothetical protein